MENTDEYKLVIKDDFSSVKRHYSEIFKDVANKNGIDISAIDIRKIEDKVIITCLRNPKRTQKWKYNNAILEIVGAYKKALHLATVLINHAVVSVDVEHFPDTIENIIITDNMLHSEAFDLKLDDIQSKPVSKNKKTSIWDFLDEENGQYSFHL